MTNHQSRWNKVNLPKTEIGPTGRVRRIRADPKFHLGRGNLRSNKPPQCCRNGKKVPDDCPNCGRSVVFKAALDALRNLCDAASMDCQSLPPDMDLNVAPALDKARAALKLADGE